MSFKTIGAFAVEYLPSSQRGKDGWSDASLVLAFTGFPEFVADHSDLNIATLGIG